MSRICLNPACKNPHNPDDNKLCHGCGANLVETSQSYLFENYRVTKLLGEGGFGRTYLAEYLRRYNEPRLIKALITNAQKHTQQKVKELFTREAEQLYQLDHPQIPKLYEYFEKDNNLYLVQEFIDGINLREELEQDRLFTPEKIQTILEELLPVLTYIEEKNLLHRDIKPDNIMRRHDDGRLMLIDFGAARVKTGIGPTVLTTIYTPGYAAIEHMMGRPVKASDVYSLGVTCIRLLTGCLPNNKTDPIYDDHENRFCWREYLQEKDIQVNEKLVAILDKMVASSLKDRYPDAEAVLQDLLPPISSPLSLLTEIENEQNSALSPASSFPSPILTTEIGKEPDSTISPTLSPTISLPPQELVTELETKQKSSSTLVKSSQKLGLIAGIFTILTGVIAGIGGYLLINQPATIENKTQKSLDAQKTIPMMDTLEAQYQQGRYQDCYQLARKNFNQDQDLLQEWIGKCGLAAAKIKANANSYSEAIAIAQTIPNTVANYQEVKDNINNWSEFILDHATKIYQAGKLEEAIKVTDTIPDNSSAKTQIPQLIAQWKQEQAQKQARQQVSLISKTTGLNYNQLRDFLKAGKWQEADKITTKIMLKVTGREQPGWFRKNDITNFSCEDLRIIDQLWRESTQGKSGFTVQKKLWQQNGSPVKVRGKASISNGNMGNFPSDLWEGKWGMWDVTMVELFNRATNCNL
ncbi:MAG: GUN4 domain-containing protein [Xenococcus sp. (in: cyanobacteria)]